MTCNCLIYRGLACTKCYGLHHNRVSILNWASTFMNWTKKQEEMTQAGDTTSASIARNKAYDALRTVKRLGNFQTDDAAIAFIKTEMGVQQC